MILRREIPDSFRLMPVLILLLFSFSLRAQISEEGYPHTYRLLQPKSKAEIPTYTLKTFDVKALETEDKEFPSPYRYSSFEDVDIDIKKDGFRTELPDSSGVIWRYKVESPDTKSIQLYFSTYFVPPGASLFIYNEDYSDIYGAFTEKNNNGDSTLMIADFFENHLIVEYFEPYDKEFEGKVILGSIGQAYKSLFQSMSSLDENGYIGVNCPEGESWQNQKHAVSLISFRIGNSGYICSGALINNTASNGTPYMLTANHCIDDSAVAKTAVAYFNYEQIGCNGGVINMNQTLSGASLMTTGSASDYTLLKFDNTPPSVYQPYYSGWDVSGQGGQSAVGIHHPDGEPKKISIEHSPPVSYDEPIKWEDNVYTPANTHWEVSFDEGETFEGSSGSPLYNNNKRIIGQLHGGDDKYSYYGKINYSWNHPSSGFSTLKSYLDPGNSGINTLNGYYPSENKPDPQFYPEFSDVCLSVPIQLTGYSAFDPITWDWSFYPNTITYMQGTDSTFQKPIIAFNTEDNYSVTLKVSNSAGTKTKTMYNIVSAGSTLNLEVMPIAADDSCVSTFDSVTLKASGAASYHWKIMDESSGIFYFVNDTLNPAVIKKHNDSILNASTDIMVEITGIHGSCVDTESYVFPLITQTNDNIENAIQIKAGSNGPYSNKCSGIQENEPEPNHTSCTGQDSWCDEYGTGENVLENSVWFYFIPTLDDTLELRSEGFDNQIAVYEANTYEDVLSGNYTIVGANDDHSLFDYNPYIEKIIVTAGQTYWVQVDGSAGGAEGSFYLFLDKSSITAVNEHPVETGLKIYPQPVKDYVTIESNLFTEANDVDISIYNSSGLEVHSTSYHFPDSNTIEINTSDWKPGIYFIRIIYDGRMVSGKVVR